MGVLQWVAVIAALSRFILTRSQPECSGTEQFEAYTCALLACFSLLSILDALCVWEALKGDIYSPAQHPSS